MSCVLNRDFSSGEVLEIKICLMKLVLAQYNQSRLRLLTLISFSRSKTQIEISHRRLIEFSGKRKHSIGITKANNLTKKLLYYRIIMSDLNVPSMTKEEAFERRCDVSFQEVSKEFGLKGVCYCGVLVIWHRNQEVINNTGKNNNTGSDFQI